MKDLIQCSPAREDFQRWLAWGNGPLTVYKGEKAAAMLVRLDKNSSTDYLYQGAVGKDNSISWDNSLTFCGVSDIKNRVLYLSAPVRFCSFSPNG